MSQNENFALAWEMLSKIYGKKLKAATLTILLEGEGGTLDYVSNTFSPEQKP